MLNPQQALELGLVQEVVPSDELLARAHGKIEQWLACNQDAQVTTKHLFRRQLAQMLEATADRDQKSFLDLWFSDQAQSILQALVARLS